MKKIIFLLLSLIAALCLCLSLAACDDGSNDGANSISKECEHQFLEVELKRPIVYDLMLDLMNQCDIDLVRVDIVRKSGEAYFSKLVIMNGDEELQLDSRTSDSVALAIRYNAPIYVEEKILEEVKDRVQIRHTDDAPVSMLFDEELDEALQRAIASENYERAQEIKNRLKGLQ